MVIKVKDQKDLEEKFVRLVHAVKNMRWAQSNWDVHYGNWKIDKNKWNAEVDKQLRELGLTEDEFTFSPKTKTEIQVNDVV